MSNFCLYLNRIHDKSLIEQTLNKFLILQKVIRNIKISKKIPKEYLTGFLKQLLLYPEGIMQN